MKKFTTFALLLSIILTASPALSSASMMCMMPKESFCSLPIRTLKLGSSQKNSENLRSILAFYKEYRTNNFGETYVETMDYEIGFGRKLKNDVRLFQKFNKLTQDGIVGLKTRKKILAFCTTQFEEGTSKIVELDKEFTVIPNQKFRIENSGTEFYVTQIYGNSCDFYQKTSPNTSCIALHDPVVGVNAILGGDAMLGEKVIKPGESEEFGGLNVKIVSINEPQQPETERTVTLVITQKTESF